jgi:glycine betaine/proline transport system substrate-binding protein
MPRTRWSRMVVAASVAVLAVAGCSGTRPELVAAPLPLRTECGTLTLAQSPWVGFDANLAVISYLARTELGCTVKVTAEPETDSWKHLADGSVDAILENWGHDDLKKLYIDQRKLVVQGGLTGNTGVIGWYVPPWMAQEYSDITDWRTLKKRADLFRTKASGSKGQFLAGDPSYVTNDEALIRNLDLDFTVVYAGSEKALIEAFREAQQGAAAGVLLLPAVAALGDPACAHPAAALHPWLRRRPEDRRLRLPALRPRHDPQQGVRLLRQPRRRTDPELPVDQRRPEPGRP